MVPICGGEPNDSGGAPTAEVGRCATGYVQRELYRASWGGRADVIRW